jgi:hypothetical protein
MLMQRARVVWVPVLPFDELSFVVFMEEILLLLLLILLVVVVVEIRSRKPRLTAVGTRCADHATPFYPQKSALLRRQRQSLGRYSSLAD